jgi:hypothetical protein
LAVPPVDEAEINVFLFHLVSRRKVSASTHNQALSAILFLYPLLARSKVDRQIVAGYGAVGSCVSG